MSTQDQIDKCEKDIKRYTDLGRAADAERFEDKLLELRRKLKKEEKEIKPHPSLQFGPISQTIAIMATISLSLSVLTLPKEMWAFYYLFSRITILAVVCLVVHSSIIWYGYNEAIGKLPKGESLNQKLAKMQRSRPDRPDAWAHTRSHPSHFLTTKNAPPRLFPFPLGKSRPDASVKDELWWEGGNAPHVGHFNKPKIAEPTGPDEQTLMARAKESMTLEKQTKLWKKRIRTIQLLCVIIIVAFVNKNVAIAGLCWLIYSTFAAEIDNMLKPPTDMEPVYNAIDMITRASGRNETTTKTGKGQPTGGMSYIYAPEEARSGKANTSIPIVTVPPHVLMTSERYHLAGPGEQIKDPDK